MLITVNRTCEHCGNTKICKYKTDFEKTFEKLKTIEYVDEPMLFEVSVSCREFKLKGSAGTLNPVFRSN